MRLLLGVGVFEEVPVSVEEAVAEDDTVAVDVDEAVAVALVVRLAVRDLLPVADVVPECDAVKDDVLVVDCVGVMVGEALRVAVDEGEEERVGRAVCEREEVREDNGEREAEAVPASSKLRGTP